MILNITDNLLRALGLECKNEILKKALINFSEDITKYLSENEIYVLNSRYPDDLDEIITYNKISSKLRLNCSKIPDLENPVIAKWPKQIKVNKNEVGFVLDDTLSIVNSGYMADIKFKLIDTPKKLKDFLIRWYNRKKNSTGNEKLEAKAMLNLPIGYCQRYNPFLRSYVVNTCNKVIKDLIDENTLFWNTDAIFSKVRRPELEIGNEIGQFKEIKCNKLVYVGNVYQINDEDPTYRGISKTWFKSFEKEYGRKYDLLKDYDKTISRINYYDLNWETLKLEVNELWQKN